MTKLNISPWKFPFLFKEERRKRNAINSIGSIHLKYFLSDSKLASTLVFLHNTSNYVHLSLMPEISHIANISTVHLNLRPSLLSTLAGGDFRTRSRVLLALLSLINCNKGLHVLVIQKSSREAEPGLTRESRLRLQLRDIYREKQFIGDRYIYIRSWYDYVDPSHNRSANEALKFETSALINVLLL